MRILIVDDDRAILKLIERVLRDEAYAVDLAGSGEEARTLALINEYDGIILDLQLGDRHGFEILQELRARVRTLIRRGAGGTRVAEQVSVGNLTLNRLTRRIMCDSVDVNLTSM